MPAHAELLVALDDEGALVEEASLVVEERLCLVIFGFLFDRGMLGDRVRTQLGYR
ncbi:hypothetical protein ACWGI9_42765 [Streptomyces sp. NPDC054833]